MTSASSTATLSCPRFLAEEARSNVATHSVPKDKRLRIFQALLPQQGRGKEREHWDQQLRSQTLAWLPLRGWETRRCRIQPRNNCWLVCQPTSSCSLPGSAGSGKARAGSWLLIPCQSAAPSHHPFHLQPGKAPSALIISSPTKPSNSKPLALKELELDPSNKQLHRLKKTSGRRHPKGQPSPAPSLPNYCQNLAVSVFKHNRYKASMYPRVCIPHS